jgi:hypothetical protein
MSLAGTFETAHIFLTDAVGVWQYCRRPILANLGLFFVVGAAAYSILYLVRPVATLQIGGRSVGTAALVVTTLVLVQAARVEAPLKTSIDGSPSPHRERESYYGKGIRIRRVVMYRRLIQKMPNDAKLASLVFCGLSSVYGLDEISSRFEVWLEMQQPPQYEELQKFLRSTRGAKWRSEASKAEILIRRLLASSLEHASYLAKVRATAIIDRRALK